MRQSGRTSRIIDFAVDQLFSCGEVIFTDHTSFEFPNHNTRDTLSFMCDRIRDRISRRSETDVSYEIIRAGDPKIWMVHMKLIKNKKIEWINISGNFPNEL